MTRPVGIREVATAVGMSVGTVSNVLNRPESVAVATVARVQRAMDELGFVRNDLARQLKLGTSTTLGMIVMDVANPFFGDLAHACESAADALGHTVVLGSSDQLAAREDHYIDLFEAQRVRGMLIVSTNGPTARIERLVRRGMPVVLFDRRGAEAPLCSVALDGIAGGRMAAGHLIGTGRRRLVFLGGPLHQVEDRWAGAKIAVADSPGVSLRHVDTPDQTIVSGRHVGEMIAAMPARERPDAIFAANDLLALGVIQALVLAEGIRIPQDIAVVGYDDIAYAASAIIPLTSVRQPHEMLAREAIRLVLDEATDPAEHVHEHILLPPRLIVRRSSAG